ncbi:hypothetical protein AURDEDRAFT_119667 [Auricularia subglabra TFB-10046 SS5]|nr:hypothetical protein AURDEDRAFT_119667 [Auricularia subglabra TFB-10046 SS5]
MAPLFAFTKPRSIYVYRHLSAREHQMVLPYNAPPWNYSIRICLTPADETMFTRGIRIEATNSYNAKLPINTWWVKTRDSPNVTSTSGPGPARILIGRLSAGIMQPLRIRRLRKILESIRPLQGNSRDWTADALKKLGEEGFIDPRLGRMAVNTIINSVLQPLDKRIEQLHNSRRFATDYNGPVSPCPTYELFTMHVLSP